MKDFDGVVSMSLGILNDLQYLASGVGVILLEVERSFGLTGKFSAIGGEGVDAQVLGFLGFRNWKNCC